MNPFLAKLMDKVGGNYVKCAVDYRGEKVDFLVKELTGAEAKELYSPLNTKDEKKRDAIAQELPAKLLAKLIVNDDGTPVMTEEEALNEWPVPLANAMRDEALRVNGLLVKKEGEEKTDVEGKA